MSEDLEQRLADARRRVRELTASLGRDTMAARRAAYGDQLRAERELAAARGEQYARGSTLVRSGTSARRCRT